MTPVAGAFRSWFRRTAPRSGPPPPVCDDLAAWAAAHPDASRTVLEPAFTTTRPLPATIEPEVDDSFASLRSFPVPERALLRIPGARLHSVGHGPAADVTLFVLPDGAFVGEVVALTPAGRRSMLEAQPAFREAIPARPVRKPGNYCALLGFGVGHYYHWGHDLIMGMRGIGELLPPDTRLVVPDHLRPFQLEMLALLGLDDLARVPYAPGQCWELEHLHLVTPKLKTQIDSPEPFRWFRDAAMARYDIDVVEPTTRLYVTRRHDGHWRTVNEPEVEQVLARSGFETVAPGSMSFREQIECFGRAGVVVGTGAGLFNMAFCPPGTKVLQLQEPRHIVHALWTQAAAMGFEYHYLLGDSVPNRDAPDADIHVPPHKLEAALELMNLR